jgi:DNA-binding beta-propeller fold protein YncE
MKNLKINFFIIPLIWITLSLTSLFGQNVFWIESTFDTPRLVKTGADGTELLSIPLTLGSQPQGMALDKTNKMLFWNGLAFIDAKINKAPADFSSISVIVDSQSVLRGMAIDPQNNKIYWTSTNLISGPKIERADRDGQSREVLIDFGSASNNTPRSISLDVTSGKMYWTNYGEGKIQRADMKVGAVAEDIISGLNGPSGIALDADSGKIFWTVMNDGQIKSADLDGTNITLLVDNLSYPNYISVNRSLNRMAWTEMSEIRCLRWDGHYRLWRKFPGPNRHCY